MGHVFLQRTGANAGRRKRRRVYQRLESGKQRNPLLCAQVAEGDGDNKISEAKPLNKLSKNYERKARQLEKKQKNAVDGGGEGSQVMPVKDTGKLSKKDSGKRFGGKSLGRVKSEIKTVDQIHRARKTGEETGKERPTEVKK